MMRRRATLLLGVVGLALLAAAAARVIYTSSGAGIITLLVIGAVLLISPFVISRAERLSVNARGLELPLTRELAGAGAPDAARPPRHLTRHSPHLHLISRVSRGHTGQIGHENDRFA
jgi:hypothetical protein